MQSSRCRRFVAIFAFALITAPLGCSLLAPSDEELMGGLAKESEGGGSDSGEAGNEAGERDVVCRPTNATCTVNGDCCSGRCRGNATCG